jgi:alkylmercury lyase
MTDAIGCCPPPQLGPAFAAVQRHAFAALLDQAHPPRLADVAEVAGRDATGIAQAIAWLEAHGQLQRDGDHLVGAHGLTHRTTAHTLTIGDRTLHTWCAYDAIAIPIALDADADADADAQATTTCPTCRQRLTIAVAAGRPESDPALRLWLPTGPCDNVMADFCAHANLFCTTEHLDAWLTAIGDPPGRALRLTEIAPLAHAAWADVASILRDRPAGPNADGG